MATYTMLSNGSRGDEVKKLQTSLINAGYNVGSTGADGIYGSATENAVRKYQQANAKQERHHNVPVFGRCTRMLLLVGLARFELVLLHLVGRSFLFLIGCGAVMR